MDVASGRARPGASVPVKGRSIVFGAHAGVRESRRVIFTVACAAVSATSFFDPFTKPTTMRTVAFFAGWSSFVVVDATHKRVSVGRRTGGVGPGSMVMVLDAIDLSSSSAAPRGRARTSRSYLPGRGVSQRRLRSIVIES